MTPNGSSSQPTSLKTRFATRFIKSLAQIQNHKSPTSSTSKNIQSERIKVASYTSMALAVGSKRAWSRSIIFKIRTRARNHRRRRTTTTTTTTPPPRRRRIRCVHGYGVKKKKVTTSTTKKLRRIVPGGERMDLCNLLEETAHFIKCLTTQVKVMEKMAHALSPLPI